MAPNGYHLLFHLVSFQFFGPLSLGILPEENLEVLETAKPLLILFSNCYVLVPDQNGKPVLHLPLNNN